MTSMIIYGISIFLEVGIAAWDLHRVFCVLEVDMC